MMQIDAHQHFWNYDPVREAWIDHSMQVIRRDFLPEDLVPLLQAHDVAGCVAVQASQSEAETEFLLGLAGANGFIKGVVGWLDLLDPALPERLGHYSKNPYLKGIRHVAQAEADDFLMRKDVQKGISQLTRFGLTYDILIFQQQLPAAIDLVRNLPDQPFILDHLAKPAISECLDPVWKANLHQLAQYPNVYCKLSGLVTETRNFQWEPAEFTPFLEEALAAFGPDRLLYGSDWPVCLVSGPYGEPLNLVKTFIATLSGSE
ncbi:MAG: amidohydrolase family protein, partial [Phaeodactylibacter sp.]|nr:amidohydrolase family protein [Phaeodactylibacter sp.]